MTTEIIMNKNKKIGIILISVVVILVFVAVLSSDKPSLPIESENLSIEIPIEYSNDAEFSSNSPIIGSSEAPVTILSFSDYQCIGCKTWYENEFPEISDKLIQTGKANIIFLDSVLAGSDSSRISQASFCANEQGKYQEYQKILFRSQQDVDTWAKPPQLIEFASDLELDLNSFESCLDSGKYEKDVQSNVSYSQSLGVDQIPIFKVINYEGREHILKGGLSSIIFENVVNRFQ